MRELHLFAGAGGGILGGILLGHTCVCAVEIEPYRRKVLLQRQRDGILPRFPIWDDIRTFDGRPWRGKVDVVCGGFPCQDISVAGRGAGINGERSGLWGQMARVISEVGPSFAFVENSPALTVRGLGVVLRDLAEMGYDAKWGVLGAVHAGAPHKRERIWIVANSSGVFSRPGQKTNGSRIETANSSEDVANANSDKQWRRACSEQMGRERGACENGDDGIQRRTEWPAEPALGRVANGVAHRVDRLSAIGDGQVPRVVKLAWETLI